EERYRGDVTLVGLMGREQGGAVHFPVEVKVAPPMTAAIEGAGEEEGVGGADGGPAASLPIGLRPGMSVSAEIIVERLPDAVYAPVAAVLEGDGKEKADRVFVVDEGLSGAVAREREVTLGPTDNENVAVLSGLEPGERVVEGPFRAIRGLDDG